MSRDAVLLCGANQGRNAAESLTSTSKNNRTRSGKKLNSRNRRWLKAIATTVGVGALTVGGVALPAQADESSPEVADAPTNVLSGDNKYEAASASSGLTVQNLKQQENAGNILVADSGSIIQIDPAFTSPNVASTFAAAEVPGDPATGSNPGAPVTIFLDFDGHTFEDHGWVQQQTGSPFGSLTFEGSSYSNLAAEVWAAVAEDYAPFNVNVTTTDPGEDALNKDSADDNEYGVHVVITDSYDDVLAPAAGTSGLAFLGGAGSMYHDGALVFTEGMGPNPPADSIAFTASHEAGHNLGLEHDGHEDDDSGYYYPSEGLWGPIMGAPYGVPVSTWSIGDYNGATNTQDDIATIADRSAAYAEALWLAYEDGSVYEGSQVCPIDDADPSNPQPGDEYYAVENGECTDDIVHPVFHFGDRLDRAADEVGNTADDASSLNLGGDAFSTEGKIVDRDDVDVYELNIDEGDISATVEVASIGANLNASLTLLDADGNEVATDAGNPERVSEVEASGLGASITATGLDAGQYFLVVDGVGFGDPSTATATDAGGFTDYGSLGYYSLTGTAPEPEITAVAINTPEDGAEVEGGDEVEVTGVGTPGATVVITANGEVVDTVVVAEDGTWTATVTAEWGDTVIEASQDVDDSSDSVTVVAEVTPVAINAPEDGTEVTNGDDVTVTGVGTAGANVTITANGAEVDTVVVSEDGTWTATVAAEYGNTEIVATQDVDDSTATVTVVAAVSAPVVNDTEDGSLSDGAYAFSGTGIPGAAVVVTILTPSGETITLETTVDADGNWAVTLDEIEAGNYVVSARQTINGVQSDISDAVTIAVVDDTTGDDDGNDGDDPELPDTGMELGFMGLGLMALLLIGGGALVVSRRFTTNS